ncbi:hypothetical protein BC936DRAFT_149709 [Jimgerdemannia flammicorona]|uniref:Uncharacterized protein n=1 Tax=Jimgerdemannia flammicorona TaxID=994334 RepID=A0A433D092_9FUNG|nr:hypothetical protein BC936DRAFT_149709 [Jimgerdemannia flammicorona]
MLNLEHQFALHLSHCPQVRPVGALAQGSHSIITPPSPEPSSHPLLPSPAVGRDPDYQHLRHQYWRGLRASSQRCCVAMTHRVLNNTAGRDWISVPVFFNPTADARIPDGCVPNEVLAQAHINVVSDVKEHQLLQDPVYGVSAFNGLASHAYVFERWYAVSEDEEVRRGTFG